MRTIVLGAGLSGLACATALRLRGADVVLVEREAEVGGLAKSFRIDGYTFDDAPHFLFGRDVLPLLADTLSPGLDLLPNSVGPTRRCTSATATSRFRSTPKTCCVRWNRA